MWGFKSREEEIDYARSKGIIMSGYELMVASRGRGAFLNDHRLKNPKVKLPAVVLSEAETKVGHLLDRIQYGVATDLVQVIGRLIHALFLKGGARGIPFQNRGSRHIVDGVDRAGFAAVQVVAVAGKGDHVT